MTQSQLELLNAILDGRHMILSCIKNHTSKTNNPIPVQYFTIVNNSPYLLFSSEMSLTELYKKLKEYDYHIQALIRNINIKELLLIIGYH